VELPIDYLKKAMVRVLSNSLENFEKTIFL